MQQRRHRAGYLRLARADQRRYPRSCGGSFDAIIEELPAPADTPDWSRLTTREAFQDLRAGLAPSGVAAVRLPSPLPPGCLARTVRTARGVFISRTTKVYA